MRLQLVSRAEFARLLRVPADTLTDIQRAARFLTLQRLVYGGKPGSGSFPARRTQPRSLEAGALRRQVEAVHDRLARVTLECLEYPQTSPHFIGLQERLPIRSFVGSFRRSVG
jgi:DNA adenine methylase